MFYELWDVEVGNGIARYEDDHEMASLVRVLIDAYGDAYAQDLDLTVEDEIGAVLQSFSGRELVEWAGERTNRGSHSSGSSTIIASRRKEGHSEGQYRTPMSAAQHATHRHQGSKVHKKD